MRAEVIANRNRRLGDHHSDYKPLHLRRIGTAGYSLASATDCIGNDPIGLRHRESPPLYYLESRDGSRNYGASRFQFHRMAVNVKGDREWLRRDSRPSASLVLSESGLPVAYRAKENLKLSRQFAKGSAYFDPLPGAGIEPAASTFRARRHYQQQLPRSRRFGKEDSNLHLLIQSQVACQLADSRRSGRRRVATLKAHRSPEFESGASPIGLPFRFSQPQAFIS